MLAKPLWRCHSGSRPLLLLKNRAGSDHLAATPFFPLIHITQQMTKKRTNRKYQQQPPTVNILCERPEIQRWRLSVNLCPSSSTNPVPFLFFWSCYFQVTAQAESGTSPFWMSGSCCELLRSNCWTRSGLFTHNYSDSVTVSTCNILYCATPKVQCLCASAPLVWNRKPWITSCDFRLHIQIKNTGPQCESDSCNEVIWKKKKPYLYCSLNCETAFASVLLVTVLIELWDEENRCICCGPATLYKCTHN